MMTNLIEVNHGLGVDTRYCEAGPVAGENAGKKSQKDSTNSFVDLLGSQ